MVCSLVRCNPNGSMWASCASRSASTCCSLARGSARSSSAAPRRSAPRPTEVVARSGPRCSTAWSPRARYTRACRRAASDTPPRHPRCSRRQPLSSAFAKHGGCQRICQARLKCGHGCPLCCHALDPKHERVKCETPVVALCAVGHMIERLCSFKNAAVSHVRQNRAHQA